MNQHAHTNRLIDEKSPYLLQHAHNPVDWYPWGEEALKKARDEDKPILVSIGYATCHWCHVMERESFEDPELAEYLNERFVAIKVDREERPDVDRIYMDALHLLGEGGGWPLNMFLTPEGLPFTGGTYFPPSPRYGRPSFRQVLERIHEIWTRGRDQIATTAEHFKETLEQQGRAAVTDPDAVLDAEPIDLTVRFSKSRYDSIHGGFKSQPRNKFPPSMTLMALLRAEHHDSDPHVLEMVEHTLQKMKQGGIYDQIGGGLARYSTDYQWLVPHFEKMLYDNALWIEALTEAYQVTGRERYRTWVADAIAYIQRDMTHPDGAFYSAEDADSEGVEGKFYVWTRDEIRDLLPGEAGDLALAYWNVTAGGNFEGKSILWVDKPLDAVAKSLELPKERAEELLAEARKTLLEARSKRPRPLLDDKILTSWNALMITAFARAGRVFDEPSWVEAATRAAVFIRDRMKDESGRLLRRFRDGEARFQAYLGDYAQAAVAFLDLFEASGDASWFDEARAHMAEVDRLFADEQGGYFDTGSDAEELITRTKEAYDGVEPAGNSAAAWAFSRLYALTGDDGYHAKAWRILQAFKDAMDRAGPGLAYMLRSLDFALHGFGQAIVVGEEDEAEFQAMSRELRRRFHPSHQPLIVPAGKVDAWRERFGVLEGRGMLDGKATAYVCRNQSCDLPVHTAKELAERLE